MAVAWSAEFQILVVKETRRIDTKFKALTQDSRHLVSSSSFPIGFLCCLE